MIKYYSSMARGLAKTPLLLVELLMHALSSTWCEFDPNTAYVVCISISPLKNRDWRRRGLEPGYISICPYFLIWYPYAPTFLFGNTAHCSGYGIVMGCYRLCIVPRTAIILWRHSDMTVIVSRNTRGRERDTRQRLDNANARRLQTVNR